MNIVGVSRLFFALHFVNAEMHQAISRNKKKKKIRVELYKEN